MATVALAQNTQNTAVQKTNATDLTLFYEHFLQALEALAELSIIICTAIEEVLLYFDKNILFYHCIHYIILRPSFN